MQHEDKNSRKLKRTCKFNFPGLFFCVKASETFNSVLHINARRMKMPAEASQ